MWKGPLRGIRPPVPTGDRPGAFGFQRKREIHCGVDLYCPVGQPVCAVEDGVCCTIDEHFTGASGGMPWWQETQAVLVEGASGVVCYGEILPQPGLKVGDALKAGQQVGTVLAVLFKDKGNGVSMLHLELYAQGFRKRPVTWEIGGDRPEGLLDPTKHLQETAFAPSPTLVFWQKDETHLAVVGTPQALSNAGFLVKNPQQNAFSLEDGPEHCSLQVGQYLLSRHDDDTWFLVVCAEHPQTRLESLQDAGQWK